MKSNDIIQEAYGLGRLGGASVSSGQSTNTNNSSNVNTKGPSNTSKVVKGSKVSALSQNFWMKDFMGELNSMLNSAKVGGLLQDKDNTINYIFSIFASYMQPIKLDKIKSNLPSMYDQIESVINSIADTFIKNKQFDQQLLSQLGEIGWATSKMNNPVKYVGPKNNGDVDTVDVDTVDVDTVDAAGEIDYSQYDSPAINRADAKKTDIKKPAISTNSSSERIGPKISTNSSPKKKIIKKGNANSKQLELNLETQQLSKRVTESEKRVEKLKKLLEK